MAFSAGTRFGTAAIFHDFFVSSPDAVIVADAHGAILEVNPRAEELFGYSRAEMLGQPVEMLIPDRLRTAHTGHRRAYEAAPRTRSMGAGLQLHGRRRDGSEFPVDIMLSPAETAEGRFVLAVVRDITDRKQAEEALRLSEQLFRSLVDGVRNYAICKLDAEGRIQSWNSGAERVRGYRADEILGQPFACFYTPEDIARGRPEQDLAAAERMGRSESEGWRVRKGGALYWADVAVTALRDQAGRLTGFATIARDITERKRAQEALVLEITNVLVSSLDIRKLLSAIASSIRQVMAHDFAAVALYDPATENVRVRFLDPVDETGPMAAEHVLPIEGSLSGRALTTREPMVVNGLRPGDLGPEALRLWTGLGINSACFLPLVSQTRALGALVVASRAEAAFTPEDLQVLNQVANQVALALDNAQAYRQLSDLTERLADEKRYLEEELKTEYNFGEIVGESHALKRVLKQVESVAGTDATVLILGETGTGKELVARAIHSLSARRDRTFVKLNCAAIPIGLLESELFGHEKGAFTGAIARKLGRLELADQGTLFLDEVGDIPLELQPKLLRALQEKEFERLGSTRTIPVDVRLVAATNRDLDHMVAERLFRSDLYYRLKVFPIRVPPLRERTEDIPLLVHYFTQKHAQRMNKRIDSIPPEVMQALTRWSWPGNVRELENFIERAVILTRGPALQVALAELKMPAEREAAPPASLEAAEREHIIRILRETHGVVAGPNGAAARLGLKRTTLNFKMNKLGITRRDV
ncbi:MAG TPA: sigma 54-interacting transcriptional regulator [Terriglobia bacterium]|nr:sigma 54-interacting transcriptional regulator [Terriglobia bacterium]